MTAAAAVVGLIGGDFIGFVLVLFGLGLFHGDSPWLWLAPFIAGLAAGLAGGVFQAVLLWKWLRNPAILAIASAIGGGASGICLFLAPATLGVAYGLITAPVLEWQRQNNLDVPHAA